MKPENKYERYSFQSRLKIVLHNIHINPAEIAIPITTHHGPKKALLYFNFRSKYPKKAHRFTFFKILKKSFKAILL